MVKCSYPVCPNDSSTDTTFTYHRFPNKRSTKVIWEAWVAILSQAKRKEVINSRTCLEVICSNHFIEPDFRHQRSGPPTLLAHAIPTPPETRALSYCDLEAAQAITSKPSKPKKLKQGTLFSFMVNKKPLQILQPLPITQPSSVPLFVPGPIDTRPFCSTTAHALSDAPRYAGLPPPIPKPLIIPIAILTPPNSSEWKGREICVCV